MDPLSAEHLLKAYGSGAAAVRDEKSRGECHGLGSRTALLHSPQATHPKKQGERTLDLAHRNGSQTRAFSCTGIYRHRAKVRGLRRRRRFLLKVLLLAIVVLAVFRLASPTRVLGSLTDLLGITRTGSVEVEPMSQLPELPNGCEITSLAICLRHQGVTVDKGRLSDGYLRRAEITQDGAVRYGPDPEISYVGDPHSTEGAYYCFTKPIVQAADALLRDWGSDLNAHDMSGCDLREIERKIDDGVPVMVWTTLDARTMPERGRAAWIIAATGERYHPYINLHCMVLTGYDEGRRTLTACDPLASSGPTSFDLDHFMFTFRALGSRAAAIW